MEEFPNAYFGFTGLLTFPDTERLREAVRVIPLDRILLVRALRDSSRAVGLCLIHPGTVQETDGPYMAPKNAGGGKSSACHPGLVPFIAAQIAQLKNKPLEDIYAAIRYRIHHTAVVNVMCVRKPNW